MNLMMQTGDAGISSSLKMNDVSMRAKAKHTFFQQRFLT